ncbi:MAG: hypothetical protein M3015_17285 [Bacteroidota bacterium]|nr:hypothetical protein [Bacteroidota bacterium]
MGLLKKHSITKWFSCMVPPVVKKKMNGALIKQSMMLKPDIIAEMVQKNNDLMQIGYNQYF